MSFNSKSLIDNQPLSTLQLSTILVCFLMNMLDGMDVLVITYTSTEIAKSWAISSQTFGIVFSAGLLGMTIGAVLIAPIADKLGRKTLILFSAILMGICIYLTSFAENITALIILRFVSGLGIGSMLATTATLTAEYSPAKTKDFWISFAISGYPIGAVLTGIFAAKVIDPFGWQYVFKIAGIATLLSLPFIYFFLSESAEYYLKTQPKNALEKINKILKRMGSSQLNELPAKAFQPKGIAVNQLLNKDLKKSTVQLWIALFMAFAALYFMTSWIPKLASIAGLSLKLAIYAGTVFNVGAFFGIITQGYLSSIYGLKKTIGILFIITAILMMSFGLFVGSDYILLIFGLLGFGIQGGFVGLYAVSARMYPTEIRSTGVGWAMGAGRIGAILGPILGGILIGSGLSMANNFLIFSIPTIIAGIMTLRISSKEVN